MGIQASSCRKSCQPVNKFEREAERSLHPDKEVDSYDKLVAWFVEMDKDDDKRPVDRSVHVREIQRVCQEAKDRREAWRQNSASYESHTSTETPQLSKSLHSEDITDFKNRLTVPGCSRQTTFSDDDDCHEGVCRLTVPISSRQTTFSDDEDIDRKEFEQSLMSSGFSERHVDPNEILLKRRKDFRMCGKNPNIFSASVGQIIDKPNVLNDDSKQRSASIGVVRQPTFETDLEETANQHAKMFDKLLYWFAEMADKDGKSEKSVPFDEIRKACEKAKDRRATCRQNSLSERSKSTMETTKYDKFRRSSEFIEDLQDTVLNDQLLDGNLDEILMSVDVLYNRK